MDRSSMSWYGWGDKDFSYEIPDLAAFTDFFENDLGMKLSEWKLFGDWQDVNLKPTRLSEEARVELSSIFGESFVSTEKFDRITHCYGKSTHDLLRIRLQQFDHAPDVVVYPTSEFQLKKLFSFAYKHRASLVPFGGGSSVVGGVESVHFDNFSLNITVDMTKWSGVISIDEKSMTARICAGTYGLELEKQLSQEGFTLGHYPQSFEFSTLGGWISARSAGQQSNRYGKIEKLVSCVRLVSPEGILETGDFPASAAGPDFNQTICGSEGIFGFITEAVVKIHRIPSQKIYHAALMPNFGSGRDAIHNLIRKEVKLAMTRLSDETETAMFLTLKKMLKAKEESFTDKILDPLKLMNNPCLFVFGLEGDSATINFELARAIGIVTAAGGIPIGPKPGKMWYKDRFKLPYLRDTLLDMGIGSDTFETSTNWKNLPNLYDQVMNGLDKKFGSMNLSYKAFCHISHSYHDGASLYFTFFYPLDLTAPVKQWWEIKEKCCELLVENGGTISHHHGVGRDHSPWLRQEKTDLGYKLLEQTKACFDPNQVMNPDKLLSSE